MKKVDVDLELIPCPMCGGERHTMRLQGGNPTLPGALGQRVFRIVKCDDCGLYFTNPRPTLDSLGQYYPDDYHAYQADEGSIGGIARLVLRDAFGAPSVRPSLAGRAIARTIRIFRRPESFGFGLPFRGRGRLLDFGCGQGKFLRRMHSLGWDVTGIDFSEKAIRSVVASGLRAVHGTLPHPELATGSFDVVTLRHALEHVPDPRDTVRQAWELLNAGGLLLVAVPNFDAWEIDRFKELAMGVDLPRHLTHFTPRTLEAMMRAEGLGQIQIRQKSRAGWIRKAAKRAGGGGVCATSIGARLAARLAQMRGRGNEIIATAIK
jgi:2-polyprenyl-3-methyl-5-hydroxy-6-metoxy-1,4-benzoquinol methylase